MKVKFRNPVGVLVEACQSAHVRATLKRDEYMSDPRQRRLFMIGAAAGFGGVLFAGPALAQTGGFATMAQEGALQATSMKKSTGQIFAGIAVILGGYGGFNMFKRSKEGENSRVSAGQIVGPLIAGAALGATSAVMIKAGETVGLQANQQGVVQ